jgi:hypothetical protein
LLRRFDDIVEREFAGAGKDEGDAGAEERDRVFAAAGEEEAAAVGGQPGDEHGEGERERGETSAEAEDEQQTAEAFCRGREDSGEIGEGDAQFSERAGDAVEAVLDSRA